MRIISRNTAMVLTFLGIGGLSLPARAYEGPRANSVVLNGQWEFAKRAGDEQAETAAGQQRLARIPTAPD